MDLPPSGSPVTAPPRSPVPSTTAVCPPHPVTTRPRNPHRHRHSWTLRTVAELLANPRYTGRQVWNRYHTDHRETVPGDKRTGRPQRHRPNPKDQWVISTRPAHPALVSEHDYIAAQQVTAIPTAWDASTRTYLLAGLIICGICTRRADSHGAHLRPAYRCRHGHTSATAPSPDHPKNLYIREDRVLAAIQTQLRKVLPGTAAPTADQLAAYLRAHHMTIVLRSAHHRRPPGRHRDWRRDL
jgi:site-specific DNA recombinase